MKWKRLRPGLYYAEADGVEYHIYREQAEVSGFIWRLFRNGVRVSTHFTLADGKHDAEWRVACLRKVAAN